MGVKMYVATTRDGATIRSLLVNDEATRSVHVRPTDRGAPVLR